VSWIDAQRRRKGHKPYFNPDDGPEGESGRTRVSLECITRPTVVCVLREGGRGGGRGCRPLCAPESSGAGRMGGGISPTSTPMMGQKVRQPAHMSFGVVKAGGWALTLLCGCDCVWQGGPQAVI
jgi:hypothetical protein